MPNPLARVGVSRRRPQTERIAPVPEEYAGNNIPYRGIEQHGVDSEEVPYVESGYNIAIVSDEDNDDVGQEPVPVRIVQSTGKRESRNFSANKWSIGPQTAFRVGGQNANRSTIKVLNSSDTLDLYIGNSDQVREYNSGYLLGPGKDISLSTTQTVYVYNSDTGTTVDVFVLEEYSVVVNE